MFAGFVPFCFAVIFASLALTKAVHLYLHANAVSPLEFVLFLPSLLLPDVFVLCFSRLALRRERGFIAISACVLGCLFSLILLAGASSQLGFFYSTGNEVEWQDAIGFAKDKEGMRVLLSGSGAVIASGLVIMTIAWLVKFWIYRAVGAFLVGVGAPIVYAWRSITYYRSTKGHVLGHHYTQATNRSSDSYDDSDSDFDSEDDDDTERAMELIYGEGWKESSGRTAQCFRQTSSWVILTSVLMFLTITTVFRPASPYAMMSTTLPFAMMEMFKLAPDACAEQVRLNGNIFPFPGLIAESKWEARTETTKGWAPGANNQLAAEYRQDTPSWLPYPPPRGFSKWYPEDIEESPSEGTSERKPSNHTHKHGSHHCLGYNTDDTFYSPVSDPMKITNLDTDIINVVQEALSNDSVKIKHVALVMMESMREELFPIQQGSDMHKFILESHEGDEVEEINARLSHLTPNAEKFTGKPGNWKSRNGSSFDQTTPEWNDTTASEYGGINVVGGFTTSSVSTKSLAAIHCGTWPMPVDKFEEAETQPYQPCIPQVFDLFNRLKEDKKTDDFLEQRWHPAFFQSVTDGYDRQKKFDRKIGFHHVVTKKKIEIELEEGEKLEELNYFGYPETVLKPHIEEYINNSVKRGKRMFLSHFTSTTHHPWSVPKNFKKVKYLNTNGAMRWHKDFDKYLNTVRWTDVWLGQLMQMLEDHGIANETLVVFVGDHGQAFKEDTFKTGTYENGHVSNFRVPIVFKHPSIPRIQYNANATSLSILPTILDLLIHSGSLNDKDKEAASDLIQDYEGQSLIRPYKASVNGRRAWNFGIINAGGRMLSITSADAPWRLVMPLDQRSEYTFTNLKTDPLELKAIVKWSIKSLSREVKGVYGADASKWAIEAEAVARWWGLERKRLWGYSPGDDKEKKDKKKEGDNEEEEDDEESEWA